MTIVLDAVCEHINTRLVIEDGKYKLVCLCCDKTIQEWTEAQRTPNVVHYDHA